MQETTESEKRVSLLDVTRDALARQANNSLLYRVVVCGELNKEYQAKPDVGSHHQKFFKHYQNENELITGLLIVYSNSWVHILEASQPVAMSYLRNLASLELVQKVKTLLVSSDVPNRFYPFWANRTVDIVLEEKEVDELLYKGEALYKSIPEICVTLLNLGTTLGLLNKTELKPALDELVIKYKDQVPKQEVLHALSSSKEIMDIVEWINFFDDVTPIISIDELVWPAAKTLIF